MDIKKLMTGANPQSVMLEQTRGLKGKWEKTGLLEGVGSETTKHGMAVMLENQAKQLLDEATRTGTSAGSEEWAGVALPLVRRIFGSIAAKEFVSVQPMNLPSGLIFYMEMRIFNPQFVLFFPTHIEVPTLWRTRRLMWSNVHKVILRQPHLTILLPKEHYMQWQVEAQHREPTCENDFSSFCAERCLV